MNSSDEENKAPSSNSSTKERAPRHSSSSITNDNNNNGYQPDLSSLPLSDRKIARHSSRTLPVGGSKANQPSRHRLSIRERARKSIVNAQDNVSQKYSVTQESYSTSLERTIDPMSSFPGTTSNYDPIIKDEYHASTDIHQENTYSTQTLHPDRELYSIDIYPTSDPTRHGGSWDSKNHSTSEPQVTGEVSSSADGESRVDAVMRARTGDQSTAQDSFVPPTRMVITYLTLTNFKSYAGKQIIGPFHRSFSSVVGPNGSGKSNVIDSLLFVFGFRASKMRQGKISALIHNSAEFPDLDYCEVEVKFEEVAQCADESEIVSNSSLVISRKAFKNNSSKYYINGSISDFTAVTSLLRHRGIDLDHKRFLILQGEVESIAQMKPKAASEHEDGLLEYLEDIIGTSKYKSPIEQSGTEAERLNEICAEKSSRVQHVENERRALEVKKNAALEYIRDENELILKQSALYQVYLAECNDNIDVAKGACSNIQAEIDAESARHTAQEDAVKGFNKKYSLECELIEESKRYKESLLNQIAKCKKDTVKSVETLKHLESKAKKTEKARSVSQANLMVARSSLERSTEDLHRNRTNVAELESRLAVEEHNLSVTREGLKDKTRGLSDEIDLLQASLEPWQEEINQKRSAMSIAQSELNLLHEKQDEGDTAMKENQTRVDQLKHDELIKLDEICKMNDQKQALENEIEISRNKILHLEAQDPQLRTQVSHARQKADEARTSLLAAKSQNDVHASLVRLTESGRIEGFHGRLGDLGRIEEIYDIAVSTACQQLDNLVVESVGTAQKCIDYLRKNNIGRANFICLDRLGKYPIASCETPEKVHRLFDLITVKDEKFRPAFYSVLQDTLVTDDLIQAKRIAYGKMRWRVVTKDGQLIDKSGTMSGGGTNPSSGKMHSRFTTATSPKQVSELEKQQGIFEQQLKETQYEKEDLERSTEVLIETLSSLKTATQKHSLEIESIKQALLEAAKTKRELNAHRPIANNNSVRIQQVQKTISSLEESIRLLEEKCAIITESIKKLQDKIMEVGGIELRSQKIKVDDIKTQIDGLAQEVSYSEDSKTKAEQQINKQERSIIDAEKTLENLQNELQLARAASTNQAKETETLESRLDELQETLEQQKETLATTKKEIDEKMSSLNESRVAEIEMRNKLEEHTKLLSENAKRFKYWQEKLNKLKIQEFSDIDEREVDRRELVDYTRDELEDLDKDVLKGEIAILEEHLQKNIVELDVLVEYRRRVEEHLARNKDLSDAVEARDAARKRCEELRRSRLEGFMQGFSAISLRLKEMYQMITMGGNAELELVDSLDPFSEGILFSVMPPKKSWKNISNLSGGEKTLSSLALVFALHHYKPTPLYVMDEIDAALDFRNVSIVASYIKERTKNAQFIVISLRNNMFELASRLVGVYKVNHMTKSATVENRDYISRRK